MSDRPAIDAPALERFVEEGYVRLEGAIPPDVAEACRALLWPQTGCDPADPATWTRPVVRLGGRWDEPFRRAAAAPALEAAFDLLVGRGRWRPLGGLGTFPIRFPSAEDPGDTGWHVDASFPGADPDDLFAARVNVRSRGRALLLLVLLSDVGEDDAPTRLRLGSHQAVARLLAPHGEEGLSFMELAGRLEATAELPEATATGPAGTVYVCHPFLVHAAQPHRGRVPRFMAQPPVLPADEPSLEGEEAALPPVWRAIRRALARR